MMLSPFGSGGSLQNSQSPVDTEGGGDAASMEPLKFYRCSILLIYEKFMNSQRVPQFPKDLAVRMPSLDRRSRLSQVEPELLVFC